MTEPVVAVQDLTKRFRLPRSNPFRPAETLTAVEGVSFTVQPSQSLGIVGESGCGKSTLARMVMALDSPSSGEVHIFGTNLAQLRARDLRTLRAKFQMVFQDPYGSLDPRARVASIVAEPIEALEPDQSLGQRRIRVAEALESVGLKPSDMNKFPHEFSGGQRQRIAIARALVTRPALIVADEPVSALDVSVQAQVLNLLLDLREQFGLAYLLISHDLAIVEYVCDETAVMYLGRIVEQAPTRDLFSRPAHPYTRMLLEAVPRPTGRRRRKQDRAQMPEAPQQPIRSGCAFAPRCRFSVPRCLHEAPPLLNLSNDHRVACHRADVVLAEPSPIIPV